MKTERDRFMAFISPEPNTGCWLWMGADNSVGYGVFRTPKGKSRYAHRIAYELAKGPIPDGLVLDHLCRVPCCVNPDHLEAVTQHDNMARGAHAMKTHCPQGHPYAGQNLYTTWDNRRHCRTCNADRNRIAKRLKVRHV